VEIEFLLEYQQHSNWELVSLEKSWYGMAGSWLIPGVSSVE
jgi:hypothetical protein